MRVPNDILQPALKLLQRVAHISTSLTVPIDHTYQRSKEYNHATLSNTAFLTPEGVILLSKQEGATVAAPSHPDAASGPSQHANFLPFSWVCCDVLQSVLVSNAACVPTNPQSLTRVDLEASIGCALASSDSAITRPRTNYRSVGGSGQQVVHFGPCRFEA